MIKKILGGALVLFGTAVVTVVAPMGGVMQSATLAVLLALGWLASAGLVIGGMLLFAAGVQETVAADLAGRPLAPEQVDDLRAQLLTPEFLDELRNQLLSEEQEEESGDGAEESPDEPYDQAQVPNNVDDLLSDVVNKEPGALTEHMKN